MFGFFSSKKDKPKTSSGTKRRANRAGQSDAAKKRTTDRAAAKAARDKKAKDAGAARKKMWAAKDADRLKKGAENKKRIAAKEAARKKKVAAAAAAVAAKKKPSSQGKNTQKTKAASGNTATYKNTNRRLQASSKETGGVKTKAGNYPVYAKKSGAATSFRTAFADARKSGMKVFTWEGKKYNTKTK